MALPPSSGQLVNGDAPVTNSKPLLLEACDRATRYLAEIRTRRVSPSPEATEALARLGGRMPERPEPAIDVLRLLDDIGSPATAANNSGRYFGFVNGSALPACIAAQWLASAWDQNAALRAMSPVAAALEDIALGWVRDLFGLPSECAFALVTGATMANFAGLAAARHALLRRAGWDVDSDGLFGAPELRVVVGAEAHVTVRKALGLLGLGRNRVVVAPADDQGRIDASRLPALDDRTIVCLQAGNVNTGAFDPFREIATAAHHAGAWIHIDGAFGLWACVDPARKHLVDGFERADSWATDAHKWLNTPYDCGMAFVRDAASLRSAMAASAAYLIEGGEREPMHYTPDSSRRARGVEVWAALRSLGRSGVIDLIARTCDAARLFAGQLRAAGFTICNDVVLNQVLVSFGDSTTTWAVIERVQADGTCWCAGSVWQGRTVMRISVSSFLTTSQDVQVSVQAITAAAEAVHKERLHAVST